MGLSSQCSSASADAWTSPRVTKPSGLPTKREKTVDVGAVGALGVLRPGSESSTNSWSAKL